jgi:phospholipase C
MLSAMGNLKYKLALGACMMALAAADLACAADAAKTVPTASPIKHVIIIIGENSSFDHAFATYVPKHKDEGVWNLMSRGIVNADGSPGVNFTHAQQFSVAAQPQYYIHPPAGSKTAYNSTKSPTNPLPAPDLNRVPLAQSDATGSPFATTEAAALAEPELTLTTDFEQQQHALEIMTTGFAADAATITETTSLIRNPDFRIFGVTSADGLANGPFQQTAHSQNGGPGLPYDSYTEDTIHRFFQMWQMMDCDKSQATRSNPSGCLLDLMPFVASTFAGAINPNAFAAPGALGPIFAATYTGPTEEGSSTSLAFFNMQQGDAPYFKQLADKYSISDNMHQAVIGGTGANHIMFGTGDVYFFSDGKGNPTPAPTAIPAAAAGLPKSLGTISLVANPNPVVGAQSLASLQAAHAAPIVDPNLYTNDIGASLGEYVNCFDATQPGVQPILSFLAQSQLKSNCAPNTFYAINNFFPGFHPNGQPAGTAAVPAADGSDTFFIPPQTIPTIGDALMAKNVSWHYYGDGFNAAAAGKPNQFCPICNPMQYSANIMGSAAGRANNKDVTDFFDDVNNGTVPSVSIIKPSGFVDGHPQSSKFDLFEAFVKNIVDAVQAKPELAKDTAIIITWDESGGFYDSGYIQPLDFFGDAPRIPFIVVSPFTQGGHVNHTYTDHVSLTKFIERNWLLGTLSSRSRDNLPNPEARRMEGDHDGDDFAAPYIPVNGPAIGDLFDMFDFDRQDGDNGRGHGGKDRN